MELLGFSGHNGNYVVFSVTIYMINVNYRSRELVYGQMLIHLPCYGYTYKNKERLFLKNGVVLFFQDIEWKKVELYGFFGNYP